MLRVHELTLYAWWWQADFLWATCSSIGVAALMLTFLLCYARMKRLLFIPTPHSTIPEST